ncbi:hypothetical protein [Arenimonas sp.]|uniref:hypothetical protein n=1 Tax=Arenimonas sp. TaxID=1872635 RepID=UPI0035B0DA7B
MNAPPRAVIVLGMHRAGTSALAGALAALGLPLGRRLVPAEADNPAGYFENADAVQVQERLLLALGRGWDDLRPLPEGWLDSEPARAAEDELAAWIAADFDGQALWAFKDPRTCRLLPLWRRLLARQGIEPAFVLSLRAPDEVARSLQARDGLPAWYARLLWAQHLVLAERDSRGAIRAAVAFTDLLEAPAPTLEALARRLGLDWPQAPEGHEGLRAHLDPGRRHHRLAAPAGGEGLAGWVAQLHAASLAFAHGEDEGQALAALGESLEAHVQTMLAGASALATPLNRSRVAAGALQARLGEAEQGLEEARALSLSRLDEIAGQGAKLDAVHAALEDAKTLSMERLASLQAMEQRLDEVHAALEDTKALSLERMAAIHALEAALAASAEEREALQASLAELGTRHAALGTRHAALEAEHARVLASRSWRLTRPLRALARRLRGQPRP